MATGLNQGEVKELINLVRLIRELDDAHRAGALQVPTEALDLLKEQAAFIIRKLKK